MYAVLYCESILSHTIPALQEQHNSTSHLVVVMSNVLDSLWTLKTVFWQYCTFSICTHPLQQAYQKVKQWMQLVASTTAELLKTSFSYQHIRSYIIKAYRFIWVRGKVPAYWLVFSKLKSQIYLNMTYDLLLKHVLSYYILK